MSLLEVRDLCVDFTIGDRSVKALDSVSFTVDEGEIVGLVGESGCGKSTIGRALLRLLPNNGSLSSGSVVFRGEELTTMGNKAFRKIRWKHLAAIFQDTMNVLDPVYKVGDAMSEAIRTHDSKISRSDAWKRSRELLTMVGIDQDRVRSYPHELSGGMKQRICTAMAMSLEPDLIIADEPTTALDVIVQDGILRQILAKQRERGRSMVLISHDVGIIGEMCDRVIVMYAGRIVELGPVRSIFHEAAHPYTLGLKAAIPHLLSEGELVSIPGSPPALTKRTEGCDFALRCPFAQEICATKPPWVEVGPGHFELCHFPEKAREFREEILSPDIWRSVRHRLEETRT
ncbi:MAG: ATP-binding cassette domain-containing protein [Actinobacteria bacterium]|nr:ATP-binding cassette domain-containing protein [Actinomycetota bacterium]